jgi:twinkle protein
MGEVVAINEAVLKWFEKRGIDGETVVRMGIYSGTQRGTGDSFQVDPDPAGQIIAFPFVRNGIARSFKFRGAGKKFFQTPGGAAHFFNADILDDPSLAAGQNALVVVEGEIDALAVLQSGYPFVVSVPDGAPAKVSDNFEAIDPEYDTKYRFIYNDWDALKKIKRIIIATDADDPGRALAEELVRRFSRVRCSFVEYPEACKDLDDVLMKFGPQEVIRIIMEARPYAVSGIYTFDELPEEPDLNPVSTGWGRLDLNLKPYYPAFMTVTGVAGAGKSTWSNQLVAQLAYLHKWRVGIASFEMRINPFVTDMLLQTYAEMGGKEGYELQWLNDNFVFIAPEPGDEDENFDIKWLIEKATAAVIRHGIRVLLIDPWNEVDHALRRGENIADYTGRAIRLLKRFGREFECLVIVVAHPTKSGAQKSPGEISLYDISDSAAFSNKSDFGVVIARVNNSPITEVMVKKVRYQSVSGMPGTVSFTFDPKTGTFSQ